jgi:hypothetical protein
MSAVTLPASASDSVPPLHDHHQGSPDRDRDWDGRDRGHHRHDRDGDNRWGGRIEIGRIQYDAPGPDLPYNRSLNGEWFTVRNDGRRPVQLRGYTVSDRDGNRYTFGWLRLYGGEEVRVHTGFGPDRRLVRFQRSRHHLYDNVRGRLVLRDTAGMRVDRCFWGPLDHGYTNC